jgi:hypothetical protein
MEMMYRVSQPTLEHIPGLHSSHPFLQNDPQLHISVPICANPTLFVTPSETSQKVKHSVTTVYQRSIHQHTTLPRIPATYTTHLSDTAFAASTARPSLHSLTHNVLPQPHHRPLTLAFFLHVLTGFCKLMCFLLSPTRKPHLVALHVPLNPLQ